MKTLNRSLTFTLAQRAAVVLPVALLAVTSYAVAGSYALSTPTATVAGAPLPSEHVLRARKVADTITPAENEYTDQNLKLEIKGYDGFTLSKNRSECAWFVTQLLKQSYSLTDSDFNTRFGFGSNSPWAYQYHDKIAGSPTLGTTPTTGQVFSRILKVTDLVEGDLLSLKYTNSTSGTGHMMVVSKVNPKLATQDTLNGTTTDVYDIEVVDSTKSPHGDDDKRKINSDTGVGYGIFRVYVDPTSKEVVAHKWSPKANDTNYRFYQDTAKGTETRHLELGRFLNP